MQNYPLNGRQGTTLHRWSFRLCLVAALAASGFAVDQAEARGGFRGGGGFSRPSGGGFSGSGMRAPQRRTAQKPTRSANIAKGTANGSGNSSRQVASRGNGDKGVANSGNRANANSGVVGSGNGNTGAVNNGNVNNGSIGSGNVNTGTVVAGNDVDVNVNGGWTGYGYPAGTGAAYATGVVVGSTATAAVIGGYYSTLPASCYPYAYGAYRY